MVRLVSAFDSLTECCLTQNLGAGKTFTMIGNPQHPGIMVLTMRDLFHAIADNKSERQYHLSVSYMEIYNETIRDLLVENSKPLALREDDDKGTKNY